MADTIFLPSYTSNNCAHIQSSDVIRVYDTRPTQNSTINYKDYFIKSDYIYNEGTATFGQYSSLPVCINSDRITTDIYYRNDFPMILIIFVLLVIICFYVPWKIFIRLFRRYQ